MNFEAWIVLGVIIAAIILFVTEALAVDLVAMVVMVILVLTGIISGEEGIAGFSNAATITVAFMFVLSSALLKTGALQVLGLRLATLFRQHFRLGMLLLLSLVALISAFINNTPVVAVFLPVVIQIAHAAGRSPKQMLIPLSYATILGGLCTLIGTSTNILVSGIAEKNGLPGFTMFQMAPMGLVFLGIGLVYLVFGGINLLPAEVEKDDLSTEFGVHDYLTEIELLPDAPSVGKAIMFSPLVRELEMDIIEIRRGSDRFTLPAGDMILAAHDILKVRCDVNKIKQLKDRVKIQDAAILRIGDNNLQERTSTIVELVVTANSSVEGQTLRQADFRRTFRAIPLAIRQRHEIQHEHLHDVPLKAGDVILAEVKTHYVQELKQSSSDRESPFIIISEEGLLDFDQRKFALVLGILLGVVLVASLGWAPIVITTLAGVLLLVLLRCLTMPEVYDAVNWRIVFLMAGALSIGTAMHNSGLDLHLATLLIDFLGPWGPVAVLTGLFVLTSLITEVMSNTAAAALLAPIALATAQQLGVAPLPFLMAVTFAASASFLTPIGYQTNTMIYSAGRYRFVDFVRVGLPLNIMIWVAAYFLMAKFYPL